MTTDSTFTSPPTVPNRRRTLLIGAAALVGVAVLLFWWSGRSRVETEPAREEGKPAAAEEKPGALELDAEALERIGLETVAAQVKPLATQIRTTGVVGPDETRVAHLRPLAAGVMTSVMVRKGDRVKSGQPLLTYDNVELGQTEAEYRGTAAALDKARSDAEVARLALERADRLVEIGGISQAEHQRRKAEYAAAQAAVRASEAQLINLRQRLARFGVSDASFKDLLSGTTADGAARSTIRAPFAGVVLDVQAVSGETVSPERELATVADLTTVWIQGDVYERDLASIAEGRVARVVADAYPEEPFAGRVTYVSDLLDPTTRTVKIRCEVKNPAGRLRLQMLVRVDVAAGKPSDVLAVPQAAIQQIDGEPSVFVRTSDHTFERRSVKLGVTADDWVEVTEGLARGDQVVTKGAVMLKSKLKASEFAESAEEEKK